jgi:hypothetical protein
MATGKKTGRPLGDTLYPNKQDIKDRIVAWLSDGKTLRDFCRQEQAPSYPTVYRWLDEDKQFAIDYARARDVGFEILAEQTLHIADTLHMGETRTQSSGATGNADTTTIKTEDLLGHRKLQIDTRMRLLKAWHPKKYGDRTIMAGDDEAPMVVEASFDIFGELLKNLALKRRAGE